MFGLALEPVCEAEVQIYSVYSAVAEVISPRTKGWLNSLALVEQNEHIAIVQSDVQEKICWLK